MKNHRNECLTMAWFILVSCVGCSGCAGFLHPAAENSVSVQGTVADVNARAVCHLQLYSEHGQPSARLTLSPEFRRSLVIAPGAHKYFLEVSCDGHPGKFKSEMYELGGGFRSVDLGTIVLSAE